MAIFMGSAISSLGTGMPFAGSAVVAQGGLPGAPGSSRASALDDAREGGPESPRTSGSVFGALLDDARSRDVQAQRAVEAFARTDDPGRIHETMVAVSKSEIALRTVVAVRNKLLDAYRDLQQVTT